MEHFLMGAIAMASCTIAMFFVRFWRRTHDRLFALFAMAFFLLGVTRLGLVLSDDASEASSSWYWVRLAAFLVILFAIVDKNRR
jgi:hypothetical protein